MLKRKVNVMKYDLCQSSWDENERKAILEVISGNTYTMGKKVSDYEEAFAVKFGSRYAVMVNSGSSANLAAAAALVYSKRVQAGDEVIVPAVSWSTTYFPLYQFGLKLVFVDIDADTYCINVEELRAAVTEKTKLIVAVNLLGNASEYKEILSICSEAGAILLEDNCESMGALYDGKQLGTIGLMGTYSSFFAHHICTMEGGMVVTDDEELYHYLLCIRAHGWTRNLPADSLIYHTKTDKLHEKMNEKFYEKYNFIVPGFNLRPLEMEGAIGSEQLKKLDGIIQTRRKNAEYIQSALDKIGSKIRLQKETGKSSWYGFGMVLQGDYADKRNQIADSLEQYGIETRPIVAGNFTRNAAVKYMDYRIHGELKAADEIHDSGFYIGNHPSYIPEKIDYFVETLTKIMKEIK